MSPTLKVAPYPFNAYFFITDKLTPMPVVKITSIGFLCKPTHPIYLKVGQILKCQLEIPQELIEHQIEVRVIKAVDHADKSQLYEFHFINPDAVLLAEVQRFVIKIGQK